MKSNTIYYSLINLLTILFVGHANIVFGQEKPVYNDGPYIFINGENINIQWVKESVGYDTIIPVSEADVFEVEGLPKVDLSDLRFNTTENAVLSGVSKIAAVSDVHGKYDLLIDVLRGNGVIDENNNWLFGDGHLVVVGDNFDRGDKVLDILWFLFSLDKEAESAGGDVHVTIGNHEIMVLNGDLRYLHRKYLYTSALYVTRYDYFFRKGSVLGDWIASHPVMLSINKNLFVHAGISSTVSRLGLEISDINKIFREKIIRQHTEDIYSNPMDSILYLEEGPVWYRGYFDTSRVKVATIDSILQIFDQDRIIIGHTPQHHITPMLEGRVLDIDCGIQLGQTAEMLLIEDGQVMIGDVDGNRETIISKQDTSSLFNYIYELEGIPRVTIQTDVGKLINRSNKEEYQPADLHIRGMNGEDLLLAGRLRARGNMRKKVCRIPPVKFDFPKKLLKEHGFLGLDKLKFVFPCKDRGSDQEMILKEYFLYELYDEIDTNGLKAKLIDFVFMEGDKEKYNFRGFMIEDEEEYARRKNARIVEKGNLRASGLHRECFLKMEFFQYMIANTDWSVNNKHNLEMVLLPDRQRVVALPYDFDYSGFVGQRYAVPHHSLPISSVHDRYFFKYIITEREFYRMVNYFLAIEDKIYDICDQATYMKPVTIKENKEYISGFYKLLRNPERLKSHIVRE